MTQCTQIFEAKQIYSRYKQPAPSALNKHKLFNGHFTQRKKKRPCNRQGSFPGSLWLTLHTWELQLSGILINTHSRKWFLLQKPSHLNNKTKKYEIECYHPCGRNAKLTPEEWLAQDNTTRLWQSKELNLSSCTPAQWITVSSCFCNGNHIPFALPAGNCNLHSLSHVHRGMFPDHTNYSRVQSKLSIVDLE